MSALVQLRRHRERARAGRRVFHLELDVVAVEELLRREELLADDADDAATVDRALARFIELLSETRFSTQDVVGT